MLSAGFRMKGGDEWLVSGNCRAPVRNFVFGSKTERTGSELNIWWSFFSFFKLLISKRAGASESAQFDATEGQRLFHASEMDFCAFAIVRHDLLDALGVEQQPTADLEEGR